MRRFWKNKIFITAMIVVTAAWNMQTAVSYVMAGQEVEEAPTAPVMQETDILEEPDTEPVTEPESEAVTESAAESEQQSLEEPEESKGAEPVSEPEASKGTESVSEPDTEPVSVPDTKASESEAATVPVTEESGESGTNPAPKETNPDSQTTEEPGTKAFTMAAESESRTEPVTKGALQELPSGAERLNKLVIDHVDFENDYVDADGYRLTNGDVTVYFDILPDGSDIADAYYIWTDAPDRRIPAEIDKNEGSFVVDSEGKGDIRLVGIDFSGNAITAQIKGIWIDKTPPKLVVGGEKETVMLMSPAALKTEVWDGDAGSGMVMLSYQLDDADAVIVDASKFELNFEKNGEYTLLVAAEDMAGNQSRITKKIVVHAAPIITVTLPTDVTLMVLSRPVEDGVNIFSQDWEVINRSNVPIRATIAEYGMHSDYDGDFAESYLDLKMKYCGQESRIPLGFAPQTNICGFTLDKAVYTSDNQYISSGEASRVCFSYQGYAAEELNQYLKYHKAVFHMAFVFEPIGGDQIPE